MPPRRLSGISPRFQGLSRSPWAGCLCSTHPFASRGAFAPRERLACIRHAASVRPEPGSNSPFVSVSLIEVYLAGLSPQDRRLLYVLFLFRLSEIAARRPSAASPYNLPPIAALVNPFSGFFFKFGQFLCYMRIPMGFHRFSRASQKGGAMPSPTFASSIPFTSQ